MDCAEDEKYLEKLTKQREWDDWKDGLCFFDILLLSLKWLYAIEDAVKSVV